MVTSCKEQLPLFPELGAVEGLSQLEGVSGHGKPTYVELVWTVNQCFCPYEVSWKIKL